MALGAAALRLRAASAGWGAGVTVSRPRAAACLGCPLWMGQLGASGQGGHRDTQVVPGRGSMRGRGNGLGDGVAGDYVLGTRPFWCGLVRAGRRGATGEVGGDSDAPAHGGNKLDRGLPCTGSVPQDSGEVRVPGGPAGSHDWKVQVGPEVLTQ